MSRFKSIKKVMAYIYMPLLFCLFGYGILYVALSPIVSPYLKSFNLFITDSANSDNSSHAQSIYVNKTNITNQDTVDEKTVQMPTCGTHYAKFEISSATISSDLYFGDSSAELKKGLGQYNGSNIPGYGKPILIGGHNNGAFNRLQYVHAGDIVTITTNYGVYKYQITDTRVAKSTDKTAYNLNQNKEQLILYTCYPFNTLGLTSQRFFVYADKISGPVIVSGTKG